MTNLILRLDKALNKFKKQMCTVLLFFSFCHALNTSSYLEIMRVKAYILTGNHGSVREFQNVKVVATLSKQLNSPSIW